MLKMAATLSAGSRAYERHVTSLDRWIASVQRGAVLSKKVIQIADIALIAISIYPVAKTPAVRQEARRPQGVKDVAPGEA